MENAKKIPQLRGIFYLKSSDTHVHRNTLIMIDIISIAVVQSFEFCIYLIKYQTVLNDIISANIKEKYFIIISCLKYKVWHTHLLSFVVLVAVFVVVEGYV